MTMWNDVTPPLLKSSGASWLMTFTDLIALLLCFFVLIFSTKNLDVGAWDTFRGAMRGVFARAEAIELRHPDQLNNADELAQAGRSVLPYLEKVLAKRMAGDVVWQGMQGAYDKKSDQLVYVLPEVLWQGDGVSESGVDALSRLASQLRNWRNLMVLNVQVGEGMSIVDAMARAEAVRAQLVGQGVVAVRRVELVSGGSASGVRLIVHGEKSLCLGC